nr:hypothetical protein [uncultured Psychroserpens sp.]
MAKKNSITDGDTTLNFRIPKELKMTIVAQADNKNISTSKYLRNLLETVFNGSYCQEIEAKSERQVFLFSQEFLQLIVWIYKKT